MAFGTLASITVSASGAFGVSTLALPLPVDAGARKTYRGHLEQLAKQGAFVKVSGLPRSQPGGQGSPDPMVYKPMLDMFWDIFGADKLVYAGRNKLALETLRGYMMAKGGRAAAEKFFWKNSVAAFRWAPRDAKQPRLG